MEYLNSPLIVVLILIALGLSIVVRKKLRFDKRCAECGKRTLEEVAASPQTSVFGHAFETTQSSTVLYQIKYQCSNCKAVVQTTENRVQ